jgi:hypothetical protein
MRINVKIKKNSTDSEDSFEGLLPAKKNPPQKDADTGLIYPHLEREPNR